MDELDFYDEFAPVFYDIKPQLVEWFSKINYVEMDIEERQELIEEIFIYRMNKQSKAMEDRVRDKRTVNERLDRMRKSISRLGLFILQNPTPKGRELTDMIIDFVKHPEEYVKDTKKTTSNLDAINAFFQEVSISKNLKDELFSILKK